MTEDLVGNETEPVESVTWNIYMKGGRIGVRCIYEKATKTIRVERDGSGSSTRVKSFREARVKAREFAADMFRYDDHQRKVRDLLGIAQSLAAQL